MIINIGLLIIPIDEHIFFRGVAQPPTSRSLPLQRELGRSTPMKILKILRIFTRGFPARHGGSPIAGWFIMDNPIKMDDLALPPF